MHSAPAPSAFGWLAILRVGMVQASLGAVVVLMTSTLNRVMVLELGLAAAVPGALVALHFAVQLWLRPHFGHASDGARRTPWIVGGVALLALAGVGATATLPLLQAAPALGGMLAALAFAVLGAAVSMAGTPLLAMLAERTTPDRRAAAAAITWLCMIAGFVVTTVVVSARLEPFSLERLVRVAAEVGVVVTLVTLAATWRLEGPRETSPAPRAERPAGFVDALAEVWREPAARRFAAFVFVAILAYSAQDLILEPFAGLAFGLSPAASTRLAGLQHAGVLAGMIVTAVAATRAGSLRAWAAGGCVASAIALAALALTPATGSLAACRAAVFALGVANGAFAVGAIGSMMALAGDERDGRAGLRLGVYGAAQAVAYALGGLAGAAGSDLAREAFGTPVRGYVAVFGVEAALFVAAAVLALRGVARGRAGALRGAPAEPIIASLG
jgi:BCD family chlorophyll transporter-like MFS transporter